MPDSGILDLRHSTPPLVPDRLADWPEAARPASRFRNAVRELATRFLAWRAQRETVRLLRSVDAATLRDLGISDVESVVYGAPEGHKRHYDADWWHKRPHLHS